ncbi:8859_t:CDS:2 [Scutellospora calospora]|uniref:8859_t:CDS:1 n=1 Tax=Scutellospora calospora TaxID=85575 RepID=A0ACA9KTI1_9GLOM|nr:8859_t:CDS:2 [Scutellospora calospora]
MKDNAVQYVINGLKKLAAQESETKWPKDSLLVEAFKYYLNFLPESIMSSGINKSKTDQLAKRKFIPIKGTNSRFCLVKRLMKYLAIRLATKGNALLFLSKSRKVISVSAISAVVKHFAEHANLEGRFTAHSLRIRGATAAMKGGLSMEQIQTIGGWVSDAARLYMRAIETASLGISVAMGFGE